MRFFGRLCCLCFLLVGDNARIHRAERKEVNMMSESNEASVQSVVIERFNQSGSKYLREMRCLVQGRADVYAVLEAFAVACPARQHAIKKLLCSGIRGKGDAMQDLKEARDAVDRAIQMESSR